MIPFPDKKYSIIYADPPWEVARGPGFKVSGVTSKLAYPTMPVKEIEAIKDFREAHFFAGIGGWPLAIRMSGIRESFPEATIWTGSCPCQPFSVARIHGGKRGFEDERHLWPEFFRLIKQHKPAIIFGEQVAAKAGIDWLRFVRSDLEASGYEFGAADLPAAGAGAPHKRQRLFFSGVNKDWRGNTSKIRRSGAQDPEAKDDRPIAFEGSGPVNLDSGTLADTNSERSQRSARHEPRKIRQIPNISQGPDTCIRDGYGRAGNNFWSETNYVLCRDGKSRPIESGTLPMVNGVSERLVGGISRTTLIKGYGNAIVPQVAALFIESVAEWVAEAIKKDK